MKKALGLAVLVAFLSFVGSAFAAQAIDDKDGYVGEASNIDIVGQKVTFDGSKVSILANGHKEGVTQNVSGESNLTSAALAYGVIYKTSYDCPSDRHVGLANGTPGQMITIMMIDTVAAGYWEITNAGMSVAARASLYSTGWKHLRFDTDLDSITLLYVDDSYGWVIVGNNGVTVTIP